MFKELLAKLDLFLAVALSTLVSTLGEKFEEPESEPLGEENV